MAIDDEREYGYNDKTNTYNRVKTRDVIDRICEYTGYEKTTVENVFDALKVVVLDDLRNEKITLVPSICSLSLKRNNGEVVIVRCRAFQQITHVVKSEKEIGSAIQLINLKELRGIRNRELKQLRATLYRAKKKVENLNKVIGEKVIERDGIQAEIDRVDDSIKKDEKRYRGRKSKKRLG